LWLAKITPNGYLPTAPLKIPNRNAERKTMRFYITRSKGRLIIRGGTDNARHPIKFYKAFQHDEEAMASYVRRLNAPHDLKVKVEIKHAFINDALLADYLGYLMGRIPQEEGARLELSYLVHYGLAFFVNKLQLVNPADWYAVSETKWAQLLLGNDTVEIKGEKWKAPNSAKSIRDVINAMNRFIKWYHRLRPEECPLVTFEPISRAKFSEIEAKRELNDEVKVRRYIPADHLSAIEKALSDDIFGAAMLLIRYGLRRSEALGFKPGDTKKDHLDIVRQHKRLGVYTPLKGKEKRKCPHWLATPAEAYTWIERLIPMHPCTFGKKWDVCIGKLGFTYDFHDVRHTFITNMVRRFGAAGLRDVQLAVGHKDLRTTMGYLQDDRDLGDQEWKPTG
jgi:integrase